MKRENVMSSGKKGENPHEIFWAKVREKEKEKERLEVSRIEPVDKMPGEEEIEIESPEQTGKMPGE